MAWNKMGGVRDAYRGRLVLVIGTGRSGTHWLGYSLGDHPEMRATVEIEAMFTWATRMALDPAQEKRMFPRLVRAYRKQILKSAPRLYLDKTHPNIWLAEKLHEAFPDALFLGIERNAYATVASMMEHPGVSDWHRRWREFPVPNRFLGITPDLAATYDDLPLASQCAIRWRAHHERMEELKAVLGPSLMVIAYEEFAHRTQMIVEDLRVYLGLHAPVPVPDVKLDSLTKWRQQLTSQDLDAIESVVGFPPPG
jgi:hypothetical protein